MSEIKLAVLKSAKEFGEKVDKELQKLNNTKKSYIIDMEEVRFSNGEGKVKLYSSIHGSDLYVIGDVDNHYISYKMYGHDHYMAPDEHYNDIKRTVATLDPYTDRTNVIMPLLYESRQHKRKGIESLDCAIALQELERMGVESIITFDTHDPGICNAIPKLEFDNFYPTNEILTDLIKNEKLSELLVISHDMGAMERARVYAEMLSSDVGIFYKRRDLSRVVNGKNPIIEHMYLGIDPIGKDILVVDDMIASGSSILEVASMLKEKKANNIYLIATFSLFTEGVEVFDKAYKEGLFTKLYTTNLTYVPEEIKKKEWFKEVDISKYMALIINTLNKKEDINKLWEKKVLVKKK